MSGPAFDIDGLELTGRHSSYLAASRTATKSRYPLVEQDPTVSLYTAVAAAEYATLIWRWRSAGGRGHILRSGLPEVHSLVIHGSAAVHHQTRGGQSLSGLPRVINAIDEGRNEHMACID
ncbi:hypothetical protein MRX96_014314 [Rhipicephalus microplus]